MNEDDPPDMQEMIGHKFHEQILSIVQHPGAAAIPSHLNVLTTDSTSGLMWPPAQTKSWGDPPVATPLANFPARALVDPHRRVWEEAVQASPWGGSWGPVRPAYHTWEIPMPMRLRRADLSTWHELSDSSLEVSGPHADGKLRIEIRMGPGVALALREHFAAGGEPLDLYGQPGEHESLYMAQVRAPAQPGGGDTLVDTDGLMAWCTRWIAAHPATSK